MGMEGKSRLKKNTLTQRNMSPTHRKLFLMINPSMNIKQGVTADMESSYCSERMVVLRSYPLKHSIANRR